MPFGIRGLTLVELLLCLGIVAFLLMELTGPGLARHRERLVIDGLMQDVQHSIAMARLAAVNENRIVTFCRSDDGLHCQGKWHEGSIVFTDTNGNHVMDGDDRLLFRLQYHDIPGRLNFHSFGNRQYLQFDGRGVTLFQNGNFTFCPGTGEGTKIRQLILSFSGRTRMARDEDQDGVVENSQGDPINCDS